MSLHSHLCKNLLTESAHITNIMGVEELKDKKLAPLRVCQTMILLIVTF